MKAIKDGNAVALVADDFINLQENDAIWFDENSRVGRIVLREIDNFKDDVIPDDIVYLIIYILAVETEQMRDQMKSAIRFLYGWHLRYRNDE